MITNIANLPSEFAPSHLAASRTSAAAKPTSDVELIERIAAGDRLAMHVLYTRHKVRVFRFVLRFVRNEAAAEELVNEVFFDVWRKPGNFEGRSEVSTWLLAIARHKALESSRRRSTEQLDDDAAALIEDPADNPEVATQKKELGSIIRKCLTQLSPAHREIIDLVYYHEKSIDDVATIIGLARNTVKTRMFYARKRLAELLGANGIATAHA